MKAASPYLQAAAAAAAMFPPPLPMSLSQTFQTMPAPPVYQAHHQQLLAKQLQAAIKQESQSYNQVS